MQFTLKVHLVIISYLDNHAYMSAYTVHASAYNNNNNNVLLNQDNYTIISYMGKGPRLRGTKQEPWQGIH